MYQYQQYLFVGRSMRKRAANSNKLCECEDFLSCLAPSRRAAAVAEPRALRGESPCWGRVGTYPSAPYHMQRADLDRCIVNLRSTHNGNGPPWIAVYGDSLSRGMFFDTVQALNSSAQDLRLRQMRTQGTVQTTRRTVRTMNHDRQPIGSSVAPFCFDYLRSPTPPLARVPRPFPPANDACPAPSAALEGSSVAARLSFRLKTFTWEPAYDEPWLAAFAAARRLPDVVLLSFGIWDMQYPPHDDPWRGLDAFRTALHTFSASLEHTLQQYRRRPQLYWLTVPAVSYDRLPVWKRPRMNASLSRRYNEIATPVMQGLGAVVIDTFSSGLAHPEHSRDGVHATGALLAHHTRLFWRSTVRRVRRESVATACPQKGETGDGRLGYVRAGV